MKTLGSLVAVLVIAGAVVKFFWWIVTAIVVAWVMRAVVTEFRQARAAALEQRQRDLATAWRCDAEDAMYLRGDVERGVFGRWDGVNP